MRAALVIAVVGCGKHPPLPDAAVPMAYELILGANEPFDRPAPAIAPVAYIDGVATTDLKLSYPDMASAVGATHRAELRYGDVVVAALTVTILANGGCAQQLQGVSSYVEAVCSYDSGDIRLGGVEAHAANGVCSGDSFCAPRCNCSSGQHCTALVALTSPFASHAGCAPIGAKQLGNACAYTADPNGAYDDCATGLVCVAGSCQQTCGTFGGTTCATCGYVPGYPPELKVCM
jgi:hypothetical protein